MSPDPTAAESVVLAYLNGRTMDAHMFEAAVWVVGRRLAAGMTPALDEALCADIDGHATLLPAASSNRGFSGAQGVHAGSAE